MLSFPSNPSEGQVFYAGNIEWTYTNGGWRQKSKERSFDMAATTVFDLKKGEYFKKTLTGPTTFTVANVPPSGLVASFVLSITNGGSAAITWFANLKWANGSPPSLVASGRDVLGFISEDNGATWTGMVLTPNAK